MGDDYEQYINNITDFINCGWIFLLSHSLMNQGTGQDILMILHVFFFNLMIVFYDMFFVYNNVNLRKTDELHNLSPF